SPVNASPSPLRTKVHDSGPVWSATPSLYETFIHNTLPAFTGASEPLNSDESLSAATPGIEAPVDDQQRAVHNHPHRSDDRQRRAQKEQMYLRTESKAEPEHQQREQGDARRRIHRRDEPAERHVGFFEQTEKNARWHANHDGEQIADDENVTARFDVLPKIAVPKQLPPGAQHSTRRAGKHRIDQARVAQQFPAHQQTQNHP